MSKRKVIITLTENSASNIHVSVEFPSGVNPEEPDGSWLMEFANGFIQWSKHNLGEGPRKPARPSKR